MTTRNVRIFRYDPSNGDSGHYDSFTLEIPDETTTTILDVLLRLQREQDPTLAFRFACRVSMCGSCAMVINGTEGMGCKTNLSDIPPGKEVTIRPLNHFPVIKDLVVDMDPFFKKYEQTLPFYQPRLEDSEPAPIRPDSPERQDIGGATECIACGCCVSSCTMARYHEGYAGPAALNRAFTLLADSRDGLFEERLTRAMESCYQCRTEFNCTEVCPKKISSTRAIKYIQRLALGQWRKCQSGTGLPACQSNLPKKTGQAQGAPPCPTAPDRRVFLLGLVGSATAAALAVVGGGVVVGPALSKPEKQWVPVTSLDNVRAGDVTTVLVKYERKSGLYTQQVSAPVLVSRAGGQIVCFNASCPHLGCIVRWDGVSGQFRCACHGGNFDRDGSVLAGPPPRPLDRYAFKVESGHLLVEVG
jgi:succinate dehydrogenase / fumarate reductase iron-sulfur subunit